MVILNERYPLASEYLRAQLGCAAGIDATVHPNDEMCIAGGELDAQDPDNVLTLYLRNGFEMCTTVEQIARWRFGALDRASVLLDFASGYGRLTRFLVHKLPAERITVSDVVGEAVEFQVAQFGVAGITSATDPDAFECDRRFDFIFAASLFTHLPAATFRRWLERLLSLLTPRGVLVFSTHSAETFDWSTGMPAPEGRDFFFVPLACSRVLDPHDYGNTFITETALRALAGGRSLLRIPRGLSNGQDLCVLTPERDCDFSELVYDTGVFGTPDAVRLSGTTLSLAGWIATRSRRCPIRNVRIEAGGCRVAELTSLAERPDVAAYWGDETYLHSGWSCSIDLRDLAVSLDDLLVVKATTESGIEWVQYVGTVGAAAVRIRFAAAIDENRRRSEAGLRAQQALDRAMVERLDGANAHAAELEERVRLLAAGNARLHATIAAMEASRFWKAREEWFRLKQRWAAHQSFEHRRAKR